MGLVNQVWDSLVEGEIYSLSDLSSKLGRMESGIFRVIDFFHRYGFIQYVSKRQCLFTRVVGVLSPVSTFEVLKTIISDDPVSFKEKVGVSVERDNKFPK